MSDYTGRYNHKVRWMNFWHQIDEVLKLHPGSLLEIGKGGGTVSEHLKKGGVSVTTLDIDGDTKPDIVGSVTALPFRDNEYDMILIAEVLEHLPLKDIPQALHELKRVSKEYVLITLPYRGTHVSFSLKLPKIPRIHLFIPVPYFWKKHILTPSGHYWEVGKKGFSRKYIRNLLTDNGFIIRKEKIFADDYDHIFFVLKQKHTL